MCGCPVVSLTLDHGLLGLGPVGAVLLLKRTDFQFVLFLHKLPERRVWLHWSRLSYKVLWDCYKTLMTSKGSFAVNLYLAVFRLKGDICGNPALQGGGEKRINHSSVRRHSPERCHLHDVAILSGIHVLHGLKAICQEVPSSRRYFRATPPWPKGQGYLK